MSGLDEGEGLLEVDPRVGEILVTVDAIDPVTRRQLGFPGRDGQLTTYVFYYARAEERVFLVDLYERFFDTLCTYKRGDGKLVRPTFGFIPGWSRLSPMPSAPSRVALVGDAAARHSPLTYCGFGATLRSFEGAAWVIADAVEQDRDRVDLADHEAIHSLTGAEKSSTSCSTPRSRRSTKWAPTRSRASCVTKCDPCASSSSCARPRYGTRACGGRSRAVSACATRANGASASLVRCSRDQTLRIRNGRRSSTGLIARRVPENVSCIARTLWLPIVVVISSRE